MSEKKTLGQIRSELDAKIDTETFDIRDYSNHVLKNDLPKRIDSTIEETEKLIQGDFYLEVLQRDYSKINGMHETLRFYVVPRRSCPTPNYDSTAFKYHRRSGNLQRLWTVPNRGACMYLMNNRRQIDSSRQEILKDVMDFYEGKLLIQAKKMNNEEIN